MIAPLNPFLFVSATGQTADFTAVRGSIRIRRRKLHKHTKDATPAQRAVRDAYCAADGVWRWLGTPRKAAWSKACPHRFISGYEFFMKTNIPILMRWTYPMISPPRKGDRSKPSPPTYVRNGWAAWPNVAQCETLEWNPFIAFHQATGDTRTECIDNLQYAYDNDMVQWSRSEFPNPKVHVALWYGGGHWNANITVHYLWIFVSGPARTYLADENHYTAVYIDCLQHTDAGAMVPNQEQTISFNGWHYRPPAGPAKWFPNRHSMLCPYGWILWPWPDIKIRDFCGWGTGGGETTLWNQSMAPKASARPLLITHWTPASPPGPVLRRTVWRAHPYHCPNPKLDTSPLTIDPKSAYWPYATQGNPYHKDLIRNTSSRITELEYPTTLWNPTKYWPRQETLVAERMGRASRYQNLYMLWKGPTYPSDFSRPNKYPH